MKILMVHNYYRSASPSGENRSFEDERALLTAFGHDVVSYTRSSDEIEDRSALGRLKVGVETVWSARARSDVAALLRTERPDIVHVQNTFPLISSSILDACRTAGVPVVQALRNYRLLCVNGLLFRAGKPCEACVGRNPWRGVVRGCYRGSRTASAAVAAGVTSQGRRAEADADMYIAPSRFTRSVFTRAGFDEDRIAVKPNFVAPDPGIGAHDGRFMLFAGRLDVAKGVEPLLRAAERLPHVPLVIAGDGPLADDVREATKTMPWIEWLGSVDPHRLGALMGAARALVVPALWYETFGRVVAEAFARGTPAIVSDIGAIAELVDDDVSGIRVPPGDADALALAIDRLWSDAGEAEWMGKGARGAFEERFTAATNHRVLIDIYERAIERAIT